MGALRRSLLIAPGDQNRGHMISALPRRIACAALLVMVGACTDKSSPVEPNHITVPGTAAPPAPAPEPLPVPPPLTGPARIFGFAEKLSYPVADYTAHSEFALYDDGRFALRYLLRSSEYRGTYTERDGQIIFQWEGWSTAGPWGATGTLRDGTLTVRYNLVMTFIDFEDAVYTLRPN